MNDNAPHNNRNFGFVSKRTMFAGALIALGVLAYGAVKYKQNIFSASEMREVTVGFRVSGRIDRMLYAEHAVVKQGELLATLDKVPFEQALAAAKAQAQIAQAAYDKSIHIPDSTFHATEAARANLETAQQTYDAAHAELEKRKKLIVAGQLDNQYNDDVQDEHDAQLGLERARRELAQLEDVPDTDKAAAKAAVQAALANVAIAETNLADAQLLAPAAGTVLRRVSDVGATVQPGATVYILSVPKPAAFDRP